MKIIKLGKIPKREVKETCANCKTVFTYNSKDVEEDWRDGNYVKCPHCGNFIAAKNSN